MAGGDDDLFVGDVGHIAGGENAGDGSAAEGVGDDFAEGIAFDILREIAVRDHADMDHYALRGDLHNFFGGDVFIFNLGDRIRPEDS